MAKHHHGKVLILGSGPAGLTAAIYAARAALEPMLVHGIEPGGQMTITTDVENYPGFADVVQGPWLMEQMQAQAEGVGTRFFRDSIVSVDLARRPFACLGDSGDRYSADALIVATGAQARWLGLEREQRFRGFGVSACATCDGFFFRDREVIVVGGGNTAVEEAIYLTHHASKVTLVHRRDSLRAEKILQERLFANPKITVIWEHVVEDILGDEDPLGVTGVRVRHAKTGRHPGPRQPTASSSPSATSRRRRFLPARWTWTPTATSAPPPTAPSPAYPASSPPAMFRTSCSVRR